MKLKLLIIFSATFFGFIFLSLNNYTTISAATRTWDGSDSNDWNDAGNWDALPADGDDLVFPAAPGGFTTNLDCTFGPVVFRTLTFSDNYSVSCAVLLVTSNIDLVTASTVDIDSDISAMTALFFNSTSGGTLNLNGLIDMNGNSLIMISNTGSVINVNSSIVGTGSEVQIGGFGEVHFAGLNSFNSQVRVAGNLFLDSAGANGSGNTVTVGDLFGSGILQSNIDGGISSGSVVNVESSGTWNLGTYEENPNIVSGSGTIIINTGAILTVGVDGSFEVNNVFEGGGTIVKEGISTMLLTGDSPDFTGTLNMTEGGVSINANFGSANVLLDNGSVYGTGIIKSISGLGGIVAPGNSPGILTVDGDITWNSAFTYTVDIYGTTVGTDYDQLNASGAVELGGSTLALNLGYSAPAGDAFTIITSTSGITGEFNGLPDGAILMVGGRPFQIRYNFNEVILTVPTIGLSNTSFTSTPTIPSANQPFVITSVWLGTGPTPTGTAELFNGTESLGVVSLVSGVATFNVAGLPAGNYSLTVQYSGDINFIGEVSESLPLIISATLANTGINFPLQLIIFSMTLSLLSLVAIARKYK